MAGSSLAAPGPGARHLVLGGAGNGDGANRSDPPHLNETHMGRVAIANRQNSLKSEVWYSSGNRFSG